MEYLCKIMEYFVRNQACCPVLRDTYFGRLNDKQNEKGYLRISVGLSPKVILNVLLNQLGSLNPVA